MKTTWRAAALLAATALTACGAHDVRTTFPRSSRPAPEEAARASIELRFSSAVDNLIVTVKFA